MAQLVDVGLVTETDLARRITTDVAHPPIVANPVDTIVYYSPNTQWRYYAERITTNTWLDRDLKLNEVDIAWALSGPGSMSAKVDAELATAIGIDGALLLDEWSTAIYAEADGEIRWGGILRRSEATENGGRLIEVVGFCGYPHGRIYDGDYVVYELDPFQVVRTLWTWVQSDPQGDIGMNVDNTSSPAKIGGRDPGPRPVRRAGETVADYNDRVFQWEADAGEGAYRLSWWDHPDVGEEIDNIMQQAPADYLEHHSWVDATKEAVYHRLELGYPVIGRRRLDLRFVEGENILQQPMPERDGDKYANHVVVLGGGSGRDMLRGQAGGIDGRLRRDRVVEDKSVLNLDRLRKLAQAEYNSAKDLTYLDTITVFNHPNAKIGSWEVGDEIRVKCYSSFEQIDDWFRIVSWSIRPEDSDFATLEIVRSV